VPGYLLDGEGRVKVRLESTGVPLAVLPDGGFPVNGPVGLEPGDFVLLLTDGVTEACSPDGLAFGAARSLSLARVYRRDAAAQVVTNLYHAVRAFRHDIPPLDDVSAVVIKCDPPPSCCPWLEVATEPARGRRPPGEG
jgi:serine phosphatase RsbU (regulator of sigma subunit)